MAETEKIKNPLQDKSKGKAMLEEKKLAEQEKKFKTTTVGKTDLPKPLKPAKINPNAKNRHINCVDPDEHRAEIAQYILALGLYPNAKSGYEKAINAQTEYIAKAVKTNDPSMNSILFP